MGYYTRYKLKTSDSETNFLDDHKEAISEISGYSNPFDDECKWYDHEEHLREYSKRFPDVLFTLSGEGEETGDIWTKYFKNGKMQVSKAIIVVDELNESKLS